MKRYIRSASTTKWVDMLPEDVYNRLAACNNRKSDLPILVDTKWKWMRDNGKEEQGFTREDALVEVLELLDSNSQDYLADLTVDEYDELKSDPGTFKKSYTTKFSTNDEWAAWISRKLKLNPEEADLVLHDLNNLRGDEWIEVMEANGLDPKDIRSFKAFLAGVNASTRVAVRASKGGTGNPDEWDHIVRRQPGDPKLSRKIYNQLQWDMNGHLFEIESIDRNNSTAKVSEEWISEDSGLTRHQLSTWDIKQDNRSEFVCPEGNVNYRLHAIDALNSAEVRAYEDSINEQDAAEERSKHAYDDDSDYDEYEDWDKYDDEYYTPSASHGDYSPSAPWNAPGMSIHDFI